jgi:4-alpha-glucanotransferase
MQDILRLGGEARMNFPGKPSGNWQWRFTWDQVHHDIAGHYKYLSELYERPPKPEEETEIEVH